MKSWFFFLYTILLFSSCSKHIIEIQTSIISDEERWLNEICSPEYRGRKAGTKECDAVIDYIYQELFDMGYNVRTQPFTYKDSLHLKNVFVEYQGKTDSLIVVGAHYDGAIYGDMYPAADDNGSGVVAVLSLCKSLSELRGQPGKTILLAFWAAEEVTINRPFNGSRYFTEHYPKKEKIAYYCNLDCFAHKDQGMFFYYSQGCEEIGRKIDSLVRITPHDDIPVIVKQNDKLNSDYVPFFKLGIPYFGWNDIITSDHIHSSKDSIANISIAKINKVVNLTLSAILDL